jgi:two-component system sensor histidine kinase SenX3
VDLRRESSIIVIEISDTGIGIAETELPLIFEQFYRSSKLGKEFPGTGLGLAIVKSVVALHSGTVSVRSTEGRGSTFTVRLPSEPPRA